MTATKAVVGPRLRRLLIIVLLLFALLVINSVYLAAVTIIEWRSNDVIQNYFYQWMFLGHLALGLLLIAPAIVYGLIHMRNAQHHRNRRAIKAGYALFATTVLLLASGLVLTRGFSWVELRDPYSRSIAYWLHVIAPLIIAWLFVLHRLAGKAIRWRSGGLVAGVAVLLSLIAIVLQSQDPRRWNQAGPAEGDVYFSPSLARTTDGQFIDAASLMMDSYCKDCHQDAHRGWQQSMHRFSSFNNPVYAFSVENTRKHLMQQEGTIKAVRFCAGCHDPVPFFSGAMDNIDFGDLSDPLAQAGITCSVCHSITHVNSARGNADYTIEAPLHYPFADSQQPWLQWINSTLVKAKPAFHKKTFMKPLHESTEFCATCHKVHLPEELNDYRWLRGQNHYDSFQLSGVSGHGISSFYYPEQAEQNCNGCHMSLIPSADFGASRNAANDELSIHDHQFPAANTAIPHMLDLPDWVNEAHRQMLQDIVRVDVFGVREDGRIDGELRTAVGSQLPALVPGETYLIEIVIRTTGVGHHLTEGTADSNELWLEVVATGDDGLVGQSGAVMEPDAQVDPWSHFVNAYVIDRDGRRIDRRNPEDIFTKLYDNQIPPGAADVVHYRLEVPNAQSGPMRIAVSLNYRKFDTQLMQQVQGSGFVTNDLPITTLASAHIELPIEGESTHLESPDNVVPSWERWNDYGIGLFRREQFRQAEQAFRKVEALGHGAGALNLARVYLGEGRLADAAEALQRAAAARVPAPPWSVNYFTAQLNLQNGYFDEAIAAFRGLIETRYEEARRRGFDFSKDYRLLNQLARALAERAKLERRSDASERRDAFWRQAIDTYRRTIDLDPENATAHYGLAQLYEQSGDAEAADYHRGMHAIYKPDDNARDRAVQLARRRDAAADHAANNIVIYDLNRANNGDSDQ